jgi:hypothetical protein
MKASIKTRLTLQEVAEHFEQWRRGKQKGERIPEQLWQEAVSLVDTYGVSRVSQTLRLGGRDLNKRRGVTTAGQHSQGASGKTTFVEIKAVAAEQAPGPKGSALWMELERPHGLRLRIQPTHGVDMLALVERFLGA